MDCAVATALEEGDRGNKGDRKGDRLEGGGWARSEAGRYLSRGREGAGWGISR